MIVSRLKPYRALKDSGVAWLREVPTHWEMARAKSLFAKLDRPVTSTADVVTCFRDGTVTLRKNRRTSGFTESLKEIGYQGVHRGDLVIHTMDAFAGACGVSDSDGKCTPVYSVCAPRDETTNSRYYAFCVREMARSQWILALSRGVRERSTDFRFASFGDQLVPVPPSLEQAAIVRFLAHFDWRIRRYIRAKERLVELLAERRRIVTRERVQLAHAQHYRLETLVDVARKPVDRENGRQYTPIGLYNHGRGIFKKDPRAGDELGASRFSWVYDGDLVLSGQFAWEGAVALAGAEESGCVASHRYPILRGRPGVMQSGFLLAYFRTGWGQLLLDHHSRGAAGRNRPLNLRTLLKEKVPLPSRAVQKKVADELRRETILFRQIDDLRGLLLEYRTRLATEVVTGKLDVREAAASLPDVDPLVVDNTAESQADPAVEPEALDPILGRSTS